MELLRIIECKYEHLYHLELYRIVLTAFSMLKILKKHQSCFHCFTHSTHVIYSNTVKDMLNLFKM